MPVKLFDTHAQFLELKYPWQEVYRSDPEAHFFLSWQWFSQLYEQRSDSVYILVFQLDTHPWRYVAFMPLRRQLHLSESKGELYNAFCMGGNHWADYTGVICEPEFEHIALPAISEFLREMSWRRLYFWNLKISDRREALLTQAFDTDRHSTHREYPTDNNGATSLAVSPGITLPDSYDDYLTHYLSANTRQKIRRFQRLVDADPALQIRLSTPQHHQSDLACFERFWVERWISVKGARTGHLAKVYAAFLQKALDNNDLLMPVLLSDGKPVSIIGCYVDRVRQSLLFFVGARDAVFERVPGGLVLHDWIIRWAIENGFDYYDLLRGDEAYKYSLGARDQTVRNLVVTARKINVEAEFLDVRGIERALDCVERFQQFARESTVARLYRQMLESWPNEPRVLNQYALWLESTGQEEHCRSIRKFLEDVSEWKIA